MATNSIKLSPTKATFNFHIQKTSFSSVSKILNQMFSSGNEEIFLIKQDHRKNRQALLPLSTFFGKCHEKVKNPADGE